MRFITISLIILCFSFNLLSNSDVDLKILNVTESVALNAKEMELKDVLKKFVTMYVKERDKVKVSIVMNTKEAIEYLINVTAEDEKRLRGFGNKIASSMQTSFNELSIIWAQDKAGSIKKFDIKNRKLIIVNVNTKK